MGHYGALLTILSEYKPFAEKLFLHSGARNQDQKAATEAQPVGRKRDKATLQANIESQKRKLEAKVAAAVDSPAKKVSPPPPWPFQAIMAHSNLLQPRGSVVNAQKREFLAQAENLVVEIAALETEREGKTKSEKGKLTKRIKEKERERKELLTKASQL